jgi:hypothetical protein
VPVPALPPLAPRSATEIIDGAIQLIRPQFGYFLRIAAIGAIPSLMQAVVTLLIFPKPSTDPAVMLQQQLSLLPFTLLAYVFATMQSGAIMTGALALLCGNPLPSVWQAFTSAFKRVFSLIGANILLGLIMMISIVPAIAGLVFVGVAIGGSSFAAIGSTSTAGAIVMVIVSIICLLILLLAAISVFARSAIMTSLVIAEGVGPFAALTRSNALSKGNYLLLAKTYGLVMLIVIVVYGVFASTLYSFRTQRGIEALATVLLIPVVPIIGSIMLLTYADLRVRREGADLDAALNALPSAPSLTA